MQRNRDPYHVQSAQFFSQQLRNSLRRKYGKVPSATMMAREFNTRANLSQPISSETVRRWLNGLSVPELHRLGVICYWLEESADFFTLKNQSQSIAIDSAMTSTACARTDLVGFLEKLSCKEKRLVAEVFSRLAEKVSYA